MCWHPGEDTQAEPSTRRAVPLENRGTDGRYIPVASVSHISNSILLERWTLTLQRNIPFLRGSHRLYPLRMGNADPDSLSTPNQSL